MADTYQGRPGEEYIWQSYQRDAGFITDPASTPDWGGASKGDLPSRPNTGATRTMIPFAPSKAKSDEEWETSDYWGLHDRHKKASFWGVGGIATDFLNAADPEKAFMQLAIDSIFYVPNVVVKWLDKRMTMQQKANAKLKEGIQKEQAEWMERRKELAKMFAGTPEKATNFLHQDFINSKGDMNVLAANMAKENPELLRQAHIDLREDGKYNLTEKQKKELQWGTLAYRSTQLHGSEPRRHEVEQYVKQSDFFMDQGLYPKMFEEQEQKHQSEEQKRAEEQYVKDLAQRQDFLRNFVAEDGRSDAYYKAVIHQDLVRAGGDWNKLMENMKKADPNSDLGKMNKALEDLQGLHSPEVTGERSQEEKDAEQARKQELLQQIIKENPFLEKIAPTLAHQIEKMEGKTNESNGKFEFKEDALNQVGVQLAVAYRFYQSYGLPAEGIDMRGINDEIKQCVETDYYAEVQKDPAKLQKMEDTIHSPSQKEKQEQQDRQEKALKEANEKLDNLQNSVSAVDEKVDDGAQMLSDKIDASQNAILDEVQQKTDQINANVVTQGVQSRQTTIDQAHQTRLEVGRQSAQTRANVVKETIQQAHKTREEARMQGMQTQETVREQSNIRDALLSLPERKDLNAQGQAVMTQFNALSNEQKDIVLARALLDRSKNRRDSENPTLYDQHGRPPDTGRS